MSEPELSGQNVSLNELQIAHALAGAGWSDPALIISGIIPTPSLLNENVRPLMAEHEDSHGDSPETPVHGHDDVHENFFGDHNDHDDHFDHDDE